MKHMPSTNFVPIVGCLPATIKMESCAFEEMWFQKLKSPILRLYWLFGEEKVIVADADLAKQVFVNKSKIYAKSKEHYDVLKPLLGNGLATAEGTTHRKNRKLCNNFFKINLLKNFVPVFDKLANDLIDSWLTEIHNMDYKDTDSEPFIEPQIEKEMSHFTLDVIGKFAFDHDFNTIKHSDNEITQKFQTLFEFFRISWNFIIYCLFPNLKTSFAVNFKKQIENINKIVYSVITKKREELKESSDESEMSNLLTSLLIWKDEETGDKMDDEQVRDEVMTFMVAGHETTAITLSWCLLEAARHPEMQQKIRDEFNFIMKPGTSLSFEDLEKLTYTKCFIQETLRLYPAAPALARTALEDNNLHGYLIPKHTTVIVHVNLIHKNPKYWDEPEEFKPERFLDPSAHYPYSFLPFIAGNRMCIGYKFALLEMVTLLSQIISKFHFEMIPGVTYKRSQKLTLRPNPSLVLKVKEVK